MKEKEIEIKLSKWFELYSIPIWFNRKITGLNNNNIFYVTGTKKKPDMVIYTQKQPINGYIGIEIKDAEETKKVFDACKIIGYLKDHANQKSHYFINNKEIKIKVFAVATQNSPKGKIFNENLIQYPSKKKWNKVLSITKNEPEFEYRRTKDLLRSLWRQWAIIKSIHDPGLGIILSNMLTKQYSSKNPKIFFQMYYNAIYKTKKRWNVRWKLI